MLLNQEGPGRGETCVTRKISRAVAAIKHGLQHELFLGNLDAKRDWGYCPSTCRRCGKFCSRMVGGDFIIATGETHTVREFAEGAFAYVNLDWKKYVKHDPRYEQRPVEVDILVGDSSKAKKFLVGNQKCASKDWSGSWWMRTWNSCRGKLSENT